MGSIEERIVKLASTLKASGIAKSDAQARLMAEEMVGVEDSVQKRFDEEHSRAQDFLSRSKNLGDPIPQDIKSDVLVRDIVKGERVPLQEIHTDLENEEADDEIFSPSEESNTRNKPELLTQSTDDDDEIDAITPEVSIKNSTKDEMSGEEDTHLDAKKLSELMEEDGPMEEKTREITEKPKIIKPKDEYEENKIDLSSMFNVNKG